MNLVCVCLSDVAVLMCLKTADVRWEDVWGIMLTWRCEHVAVRASTSIIFIILIVG